MFLAPFLLNETTHFVQNGVVSSMFQKQKIPNGAILNGIMGLLLSLDARGRGRRRIFLPCFSLPLSPKASKRCRT